MWLPLGLLAALPSVTRDGGVLSILPENPHYFVSPQGKPHILVGDYTWGTFSDREYDYRTMFDTLRSEGLNYARVWVYWGNETGFEDEHFVPVVPYLRTGPGLGNDGRPRFDLTRFDPAFFKRLRDVCAAAKARGIFLQLTLFDAWMIKHPHLWRLHAYCRDNNINGVDGDPRNTGKGTDGEQGFCSLGNPEVMAYQKAFMRQVIENVGEFGSILFEIANENYYNADWEKQLCEFIHTAEAKRPKQHLAMPLDLPNHDHGGIKTWSLDQLHANLLQARQLGQPLIFDTDGIGNPEDAIVRRAAWTAFASGGNVSYLDDSLQPGRDPPGDFRGSRRATLRNQLGHLARFAARTRFWEMTPSDAAVKAGSAYVLASARELVAYLPSGGAVTIGLPNMRGPIRAQWYSPRDGQFGKAFRLPDLGERELTSPNTDDWVLHVRSAN